MRRVMVTGHRPQSLSPAEVAWSQVTLHRVAARLRNQYGAETGISGMALGADTWWALAVLAAGMDLHAYLPFAEQPKKWPEHDRALWGELRGRAAHEVLVGGEHYDVRMLHARNDAMLEACDLVVALYKPGNRGGTASAVTKARQRGLPLLMLDPTRRHIERVGW